MAPLKEMIDKKRGIVNFLFGEEAITYEAVEKLYKRISPLLKTRRKKGIKEGESIKYETRKRLGLYD